MSKTFISYDFTAEKITIDSSLVHFNQTLLVLLTIILNYSLLWETLTGREHLLFYGRLKNLKGAALLQVFHNYQYGVLYLRFGSSYHSTIILLIASVQSCIEH